MSGDEMRLSLRETRLVTERIVMLLGVPKGSWAAVREVVVAAEAAGLGGLAFLDRCPADAWDKPTITGESGPRITVAAQDVPAPFAVPALLDLAIATATEHGEAEIRVSGLTEAGLLPAVSSLAARFGAEVNVETEAGLHVLRARPKETAEGSRAAMAGGAHLLDAALHGIVVSAELWWRLYHRSNDALTVDTPLSRNHAGAALLSGDAGLTETDPDYVAEAAS
ncbi:hypothetical protein [Prauserella cavernicola]|uniref:Uncharacterized protein n=1 Tax=Prauserella cavernicola TaxID=2800127 RepID=A0A934QMY2_9PSEU|nr:hypothetical protein [Prauserella cavernicola]MBK1782733.1 hypothetical protein [Prauserella cavernicola]